MPRVEVTRTYLELLKPGDLVAAASSDPGLRLERVRECPASFHRYLYAEVGRAYHWVDRLRRSGGRGDAGLPRVAHRGAVGAVLRGGPRRLLRAEAPRGRLGGDRLFRPAP